MNFFSKEQGQRIKSKAEEFWNQYREYAGISNYLPSFLDVNKFSEKLDYAKNEWVNTVLEKGDKQAQITEKDKETLPKTASK